jgi:hypothetical protein
MHPLTPKAKRHFKLKKRQLISDKHIRSLRRRRLSDLQKVNKLMHGEEGSGKKKI